MSETETPGKVWICPGCGARYDAPTTCSAQHPPLECDEYDLAPEPASEEGDSSSAPADTSNESSEPDTPPEATGDVPAPEPEPAPEVPSVDLALVQQALANFDAAYTAFKTKLGL